MVNTELLSYRLLRLPLWVGMEERQAEAIQLIIESVAMHLDRVALL